MIKINQAPVLRHSCNAFWRPSLVSKPNSRQDPTPEVEGERLPAGRYERPHDEAGQVSDVFVHRCTRLRPFFFLGTANSFRS